MLLLACQILYLLTVAIKLNVVAFVFDSLIRGAGTGHTDARSLHAPLHCC